MLALIIRARLLFRLLSPSAAEVAQLADTHAGIL